MKLKLLISVCFGLFFASLNANAEGELKKVGVITPLSGGMATIGTAVRNGIELARKDRPEIFRGIEFAYEDDQFEAQQDLSAYRKLRTGNPPTVVLGFGTILAQVVGPLFERDKTPFINFNFESAPAVGMAYTVRSLNHTDEYMGALGDYLAARGNSPLPVVQTEATFLHAMVLSLERGLQKRREIQNVATVNPGDTDFRTIITKLKTLKSREIGIFLWPDQLLIFFKQARELGLTAQYFGTDLCETASAIAAERSLGEGCLYPDNEVTQEFRNHYRESYGNEAQLTFAGSAYDVTMLLGEFFANGKASSGEQLLTYLTSLKNRVGVLGKFSYRDEKGFGKYLSYPILVKAIRNGRGVPVEDDLSPTR